MVSIAYAFRRHMQPEMPPPTKIHIILAATIKANVSLLSHACARASLEGMIGGMTLHCHVSWSSPQRDAGACATESIPMLRALSRLRDIIGDTDLIVFAHAHSSSWHAPWPLRKALSMLHERQDYLQQTAWGVGGLYCTFASQWAARQLAYSLAEHRIAASGACSLARPTRL